MHPGELGRHADDVDAPGRRGSRRAAARSSPVVSSRPLLSSSTPSARRGDSRPASCSRLSSSFSFLLSFDGTSTSTVTSRSPWPPFVGAPLPRSRNVLPDGVPAGTFSVTGPFSVGTFTFAPSAASANVTGSVDRQVVPLAAEHRCAAARCTTHVQVARLTARRPGASPRPGQLDPRAVASRPPGSSPGTPASAGRSPTPWHVGQGSRRCGRCRRTAGRAAPSEQALVHRDLRRSRRTAGT